MERLKFILGFKQPDSRVGGQIRSALSLRNPPCDAARASHTFLTDLERLERATTVLFLLFSFFGGLPPAARPFFFLSFPRYIAPKKMVAKWHAFDRRKRVLLFSRAYAYRQGKRQWSRSVPTTTTPWRWRSFSQEGSAYRRPELRFLFASPYFFLCPPARKSLFFPSTIWIWLRHSAHDSS